MTTIDVFLAKDEIDGEMSFFAFEHKTGSHWHMYSHYTVIDINSYRAESLAEKLDCFIGFIKTNNGCEWVDENEERRMCNMINPVYLESFELDADVDIKVRKSACPD